MAPLGGDGGRGLHGVIFRPGDLFLVEGEHPAEVLRQVVRVEAARMGVAEDGAHTVVARHDDEAAIARHVEHEVIRLARRGGATQRTARLPRGGGVHQ